MARTIAGDDQRAGQPYEDVDGDVHWNATTVYAEAATIDFAEGVLQNFIVSGTVAVTVPTIAADKQDVVDVDVAAAFTASIAVGDGVIACPLAALPTDCLLANAYVTATDHISVVFVNKEGGSGVTGAAVNFKFIVIKAAASA